MLRHQSSIPAVQRAFLRASLTARAMAANQKRTMCNLSRTPPVQTSGKMRFSASICFVLRKLTVDISQQSLAGGYVVGFLLPQHTYPAHENSSTQLQQAQYNLK
jgi:hypothetical protein